MSIDSAMTVLANLALALPGVKSAPVNPPESAGAYPMAVVYPREGEFITVAAGFGKFLHSIYLEIHFSRQFLPASIQQARAIIEPMAQAIIANPTLSGSVAEVQSFSYILGQMFYGEVPTIGIRFTVKVKINQT